MKYLTIDDVCDMLSISRRTLERMRPDTMSDALARLQSNAINHNHLPSNLIEQMGMQGKKMNFPEPDLYIGKSPRWEQDKLIEWLENNGRYL